MATAQKLSTLVNGVAVSDDLRDPAPESEVRPTERRANMSFRG